MVGDFCGVADTPAAGRGWGCVNVVSEHKYWQPCMFKLRVHTYEVSHSIKRLIFGNYSTMSGRGRRGRLRGVIPEAPERPEIPVRDEHVVGSTTASMNQPPAAGQAGARIVYARASGTDCTDSSHSDPSAVVISTAT